LGAKVTASGSQQKPASANSSQPGRRVGSQQHWRIKSLLVIAREQVKATQADICTPLCQEAPFLPAFDVLFANGFVHVLELRLHNAFWDFTYAEAVDHAC